VTKLGISHAPGSGQDEDEELTMADREVNREVGVRVVSLIAGERATLKANERIARVDWSGKKFYVIIVEEPASPRAFGSGEQSGGQLAS
jgi:hypothetical protein